ncbi:MAG TPA: hypothetical protein V6D22_02885, partial [Candidatus Obscuribacterales bacterium]
SMLFQPIVSKALEKNPNLRYQSAAEMKAALEKIEKPLQTIFLGNSGSRNRHSAAEKMCRAITVGVSCLIGGAGVVVMAMLAVHKLREAGLTFLPRW